MSLATSHAGIATAPDLTTVLLVTLTLLFMLWRTVVLHAVRLEAITPIAVFVTAAQVVMLSFISERKLFRCDSLLKEFCVFSSTVCGGPPA